jgi:hypothetical protein
MSRHDRHLCDKKSFPSMSVSRSIVWAHRTHIVLILVSKTRPLMIR